PGETIIVKHLLRAATRYKNKGLSLNKTFALASGFWPALAAPQSQNPRRSPATQRSRTEQLRTEQKRRPSGQRGGRAPILDSPPTHPARRYPFTPPRNPSISLP